MKIDLKKYFLSDDLSETVGCDVNLSDVEINGVKPFSKPAKVQAEFRSFAGSVILEASAVYTVAMPCDRCATDAVQEKIVHFSHTLVRELNGEDDESLILVSDERLDLDELLREDILLDLPSKFLCSPDCRGLCPQCGVNLNLEQCSCVQDVADPRLAVLKSLLQED